MDTWVGLKCAASMLLIDTVTCKPEYLILTLYIHVDEKQRQVVVYAGI